MKTNFKNSMIEIIFLTLIMCLFVVTSQILLKHGLFSMGGLKINNFPEFFDSFLKLFGEKYIYFGGITSLIGTAIFLIILSKKDLSFIVPVSNGLFYVVSFILSWLILGENITIWKITGAAIILAGVSLFFR